ncbi:efflux RND transporter periplasmic adaptor subunit [Pseudoalteromonas luteoviolacea]|uniref:efflux RND transporter periplasmic adaptor subunit n=1 Tax=Pseudoalteromonas luteoviolacea TaxID=43657 RepID=UPI001EEF5F2E|nr:efflux RND transporter periplasmic adaptor subunit [Pseudoalteromonas luteoviolacea]
MPNSIRHFILANIVIGSSFLSINANSTPAVRVGEAQPWQKGIQQPLYCHADVPFRQQISSHVSAELTWLLPAGSQVKKGELLAKQNDFYLKRQLAQLDANAKAAHANYIYSFNEYERLSKLDEGGVVSSSELQQHKRDYQTALEQNKIYAEQFRVVEHQLNNLTHWAPADGVVLSLSGQPGQWVGEGESILEFLPAEHHEMTCRVALDLYQEFNHFKDVELAVSDGTELVLDRHAGLVSSEDQTINLHLKFKNTPPEKFLIGQRYVVYASMAASNLTKVPYDALTINNSEYYVWRVSSGNQVSKVVVEIIDSEKNYSVIQGGIQVGDKLVVKGKVALKEDTIVTINDQGKL